MHSNRSHWTLQHLHEHLQYAIQLEYWTVPFYMSAMYSIKDPTSAIYKLVQSVVYQEMLHIQLACNIANAFGAPIDLEHAFIAPIYVGKHVPHLKFTAGETGRDPLEPGMSFTPYSAEIGPLDEERINAMCLIEYPEAYTDAPPELNQKVTDYSSIGEFYRAVQFGATQHVDAIQAHHNQVDIFANFYRGLSSQRVDAKGVDGLDQVIELIRAITDQGEGVRRSSVVPPAFRNTADGFNNDMDHFAKFELIKTLPALPECYSGVADPRPGSPGHEAQQILLQNFQQFRADMVSLFNGHPPAQFGPNMARLGGNILNCWRRGALPRYS